jgi:response regulator RpfG family c-di-GMP phosphodiesterase
MPHKVLLVDDEENVLQGYQRVLRRRFAMDVALGGREALELLDLRGPYAVIVSDMRMPGMDGAELLGRVKETAPDTIRIMLTGNSDQTTAVEAVNRGAIFRFLSKPCDSEDLASALDAGIRQFELVTAEKQLLERTLKGSLAMLVELLSILDPASFGRAQALASLAEEVAREMAMPSPWVLGIAAILSQIGILTMPDTVVAKMHAGGYMNSSEREIANRVPEIGANLIRHIPRLEEVADAVFYMNKNYNGTGFPPDGRKGEEIPLAGRILRVARDYLALAAVKDSPRSAVAEMENRTAWYDLEVLRALGRALRAREAPEAPPQVRAVELRDLQPGQVLAEEILTETGLLVVPRGTRLGLTHLEKLRNFARLAGIREPIAVLPER